MRDRADVDLERRRFLYLGKRLYRLSVHVRLRELESFPSDPGIFVIAPLAPIFFLHLLGVHARKDFLHPERGFVERAEFTAAGFSAHCHDLNASILDALWPEITRVQPRKILYVLLGECGAPHQTYGYPHVRDSPRSVPFGFHNGYETL
jgi:hypothetical protein